MDERRTEGENERVKERWCVKQREREMMRLRERKRERESLKEEIRGLDRGRER